MWGPFPFAISISRQELLLPLLSDSPEFIIFSMIWTGSFMGDLLNLPPDLCFFHFLPLHLHPAYCNHFKFSKHLLFTMWIPCSNSFIVHQPVKYISNSLACLILMPFCELSTFDLPSITLQPFPKQELSLSLIICLFLTLILLLPLPCRTDCLLMCANCQEGNDA